MRVWSLGRRGNLYLEQGPWWAFLVRDGSMHLCGWLPHPISEWFHDRACDKLYDWADAKVTDVLVSMDDESYQVIANQMLDLDELKRLEEYERALRRMGE